MTRVEHMAHLRNIVEAISKPHNIGTLEAFDETCRLADQVDPEVKKEELEDSEE